jgi:hypothetical protein
MFAHQYLARVMREPLTRQLAQGCKWETDHGFARFGGKRGLSPIGFKATSKSAEVTLDAPWQDACRRQMEFYQWPTGDCGGFGGGREGERRIYAALSTGNRPIALPSRSASVSRS